MHIRVCSILGNDNPNWLDRLCDHFGEIADPFLVSDLNERRPAMPIVHIMVTREGSTSENDSVTTEQKGRLIKGVSELLLEVLNKPLDACSLRACGLRVSLEE
jgi:Tautomerase enzyme